MEASDPWANTYGRPSDGDRENHWNDDWRWIPRLWRSVRSFSWWCGTSCTRTFPKRSRRVSSPTKKITYISDFGRITDGDFDIVNSRSFLNGLTGHHRVTKNAFRRRCWHLTLEWNGRTNRCRRSGWHWNSGRLNRSDWSFGKDFFHRCWCRCWFSPHRSEEFYIVVI